MIKPNDDNYQNMPALCFSAFDKGKQSIILIIVNGAHLFHLLLFPTERNKN